MKKVVSISIAVVLALVTLTIFAFAADTAPEFTMKANTETAKVGDVVKIDVGVSANSNLCATTVDLVFDENFFEFQTITDANVMYSAINEQFAPGTVRYGATKTTGGITEATTLFSVELKVKKVNGRISLNVTEAHVPVEGSLESEDVLADIKVAEPITIGCAHADKTVVTINPTCTAEGSKTSTCKACGKVESESLKALGHKYESVYTVDKQPTCTTDGSKSQHCTNEGCNEKIKVTVINKTGHNMGEWEASPAATCTKDGKEVRKCSGCDKKEERTVKALGHKYSSEYTVDKEPTCTTDGSKSQHCTNEGCNEKTKVTVINKTGHKPGEWETVTEPTLAADGKQEQKCTVCEKVLDTKAIPKLVPHTSGDVDGDGKVSATDARKALKNALKLEELNDAQLKAADVIGNDGVTAADARFILRVALGLEKLPEA